MFVVLIEENRLFTPEFLLPPDGYEPEYMEYPNGYQEAGKIKNPRENVLIFKTMVDGLLHFNTTRIVRLDPTDIFQVTKAEIESREQVFEVFDFLKDNFSAFENAELVTTAIEIGVRESRMIEGEYTLTGDEIKKCARFDDSIATGNYDIDIHNPEGSLPLSKPLLPCICCKSDCLSCCQSRPECRRLPNEPTLALSSRSPQPRYLRVYL